MLPTGISIVSPEFHPEFASLYVIEFVQPHMAETIVEFAEPPAGARLMTCRKRAAVENLDAKKQFFVISEVYNHLACATVVPVNAHRQFLLDTLAPLVRSNNAVIKEIMGEKRVQAGIWRAGCACPKSNNHTFNDGWQLAVIRNRIRSKGHEGGLKIVGGLHARRAEYIDVWAF